MVTRPVGGKDGRLPAIVIAGPTASGKSVLALAVAEAFGGTIINAAGGTGLYLRARRAGLAPIPDVRAVIRAAARERMAALGAPAFHAELARRDPAMAARLAPADRQRLVRAWEVLEATGRSLADWQREPAAAPGDEPALATLSFVLEPPRPALYAACDARFRAMVEAGALAEAERLVRLGLDPDLPAMKAVGVPQLIAHLRGEVTLETAIAAAQQATRRYAKRQFTWFRHQMAGAERIHPEGVGAQFLERLQPSIFAFIRQFLLTL
jgi:tRNA dimethylallyltransferase